MPGALSRGRTRKKSVLRYHRGAKVIVDADPSNMLTRGHCGLISGRRRNERANSRRGDAGVCIEDTAEVDKKVFGLNRPAIPNQPFAASAGCPSHPCVRNAAGVGVDGTRGWEDGNGG